MGYPDANSTFHVNIVCFSRAVSSSERHGNFLSYATTRSSYTVQKRDHSFPPLGLTFGARAENMRLAALSIPNSYLVRS